MKNKFNFWVISLMLLSYSCSNEVDVDHSPLTRCYNKDGIVVDCKDVNNPEFFIENMQDKSSNIKWAGVECTILVNGKECRGIQCFKSRVSNCNNTSGSTKCVVCGNCGNPPECMSSF